MKIWKPFPKQEIALSYTYKDSFEILFGGARGPGKTDTGLVYLLGENISKDELYIHHPRYTALVLRKTYDDLVDWLDRAANMYRRYGAKVIGKPARVQFPSGAVFRAGHLRDSQAYMKYQGHEYQRILIEELTQIPEEKHYVQILGSCRSTISELRPQVFNTTNPGGPGHMWVKQRFIDQEEPMKPFRVYDKVLNKWSRPRVFIPSTLDDNPAILKKDPGYLDYLDSIRKTDNEMFRAWRYGDWDVFAGQVFREFRRDTHVIRPLIPKKSLTHILCMDWGYSENSAFAAYMLAVAKMQTQDGDSFNQVIAYKEWYGNQKDPDEWAEIIYNDCKAMGIKPDAGYTDPAMHNTQTDGSISISNLMEKKWERLHGGQWLKLKRGSNNRIQGVATVHKWLSMSPLGTPYMVFTENNVNMIRTLPMLVYDEHKVEDVDCFVAGTMIDTINGKVSVENIKNGDLILTPVGYRKAYITGSPKKTETTKVKLSNGCSLEGTSYHKVFVRGKGLIELQNLKMFDILETWNTSKLTNINTFFTTALSIENTMIENTTNLMERIYQKDTHHYIGRSGLIIRAIFQMAIMFITRIIIRTIMIFLTSSLLVRVNMQNYTTLREKIYRKKSKGGGIVQRVKRFLEIMLKKCIKDPLSGNYLAVTVKELLRQNTKQQSIVQNTSDITENGKTAKYVKKSFGKETTKNQEKPVHIVAVGSSGNKEVYRLSVEQTHMYYANGILCTNTTQEDHAFDALKYGLSAIKFIGVSTGQSGHSISRVRRFDREGDNIGIDLDKFKERPRDRKKYFA